MRSWMLLPAFLLIPANQAAQTGDVVVVFETTTRGRGDVDLFAARVSPDGRSQWIDLNAVDERGFGDAWAPMRVADSGVDEVAPVVCEDGAGGVFVAYEEDRGFSGIAIRLQHLDADGERWRVPVLVEFSRAGPAEMVLLPDGQGGVFLVYTWTAPNGNRDIHAQHAGPDGTLLWDPSPNPHGVPVAASEWPERRSAAVPDGSGGLLVFFEREGGPRYTYNCDQFDCESPEVDIWRQQVQADGQPKLFTYVNSYRVDGGGVSTDLHAERRPAAVDDGMGGANVVFEIEYFGDRSYGELSWRQRVAGRGGDIGLWFSRVQANGQGWGSWAQVGQDYSGYRGYPLGGPVLRRGGDIAHDRQPTAISDGWGGMIVAFASEYLGGDRAGERDIVAQRISHHEFSPTWHWNRGQPAVALTRVQEHDLHPLVVPDGAGGAIVAAMTRSEAGGGISAQRLSDAGQARWGQGVQAIPADEASGRVGPVAMAPDGVGGVVLVYTRAAADGTVRLLAQRVDGNGALPWSSPTVIARSTGRESSVAVVLLSRQ